MIRPPAPNDEEVVALRRLSMPCCWLDASGTVGWTNAAFRLEVGAEPGDLLEATALSPLSGLVPVVLEHPPFAANAGVDIGGAAYGASLSRLEGDRCLIVLSRLPASPVVDQVAADAGKFRALFDNAPAGIICSDVGTRVSFVNERCADVFGVDGGELLGFGWLDLMADDRSATDAMEAVTRAVEESVVSDVQLVIARPDDEIRLLSLRFAPISSGLDNGFVATVDDVTDAATLAAELERQSTTDTLTGLANRRTLQSVLSHSLSSATLPALLFLDLDNFKVVNDTLGHQAGDDLLCEVAARLRSCVRDRDLVARLGGDEFVVLLVGDDSVGNAQGIAARVVEEVNRPYTVTGQQIGYVSASVGVVLPALGADAESVLADADLAMYEAKKSGKNRSVVYDDEVRSQSRRRQAVVDLLTELHAGDRSSVRVVYQPICAPDGTVRGFEALCRMTDAAGDPVAPDEFIPIAEETGLVVSLGAVVRDLVVDQLAAWGREGLTTSVTVNVSAAELRPDLPTRLAEELAARDLSVERLGLELTESAVMADVETSRTVLGDLAALGVAVSIDDFGTGHSSLAYVKWLPATQLKVDRTFVANVGESAVDAAILAAILTLASSLDLDVVAEGVETEDQRDLLVEAGVPWMQGWLFSRPLEVDDATAVLRAGSVSPGPTG